MAQASLLDTLTDKIQPIIRHLVYSNVGYDRPVDLTPAASSMVDEAVKLIQPDQPDREGLLYKIIDTLHEGILNAHRVDFFVGNWRSLSATIAEESIHFLRS